MEIAQTVQTSMNKLDIEIQHGPPRTADIKDSIGTMDRARDLLGFSPRFRLEEGLKRTLQWYQESR
jgi:UDP-N-acetylglucosamine 4-epimerase